MKELRTLLPNIASDTVGASSALFEAGGLTVIHDAGGSIELFVTFEEGRELEGRRTVGSRLSQLEAVTGDDRRLLETIRDEVDAQRPEFIAILGTPVPFTIGADLEGIAAEAEFSTGVPAFAVNSGGFEPYDKGAGEAIRKLIEKVALPPNGAEDAGINLLGATPLDYSSAEIAAVCARLRSMGAERVNVLAMDAGIEVFRDAAQAKASLVVSMAGLPAARYLKERFGIPYFIGVPLSGESSPATLPEPIPGRETLIIGEAVLAKTLARRCMAQSGHPAVAGIVGGYDPEIFPDVPHILLDTEEKIRRELAKRYFAVVGDPLYRLLLPKDSGTHYIERPHRAQSGRLYPPTEVTPEEIAEILKNLYER